MVMVMVMGVIERRRWRSLALSQPTHWSPVTLRGHGLTGRVNGKADGVMILEPLTNVSDIRVVCGPISIDHKKEQESVCICREATITACIGGDGLMERRGGGNKPWKNLSGPSKDTCGQWGSLSSEGGEKN
jgi:hypothetical protein